MGEFRAVSFNVHSMTDPVRVGDLNAVLVQYKINVCMIQETFLKSHHPHLDMADYKLYRNDRVGVRGGGTAIAVRNDVEAMVVPIAQLAALSVLEATAIMIKLDGGRKLFCISVYNRNKDRPIASEMNSIFERLCLDRDDHLYIVGGDFNAHHQHWGCARTHTRGREMLAFCESAQPLFGVRVLAPIRPSRPETRGFPDLMLVKDTISVRPIADDAVNALPSINASFSDHEMLVLVCRDLLGESLPAPRDRGRFSRLRQGVATIDVDKFRAMLHYRCPLYGMDIDSFNSLAEKVLD